MNAAAWERAKSLLAGAALFRSPSERFVVEPCQNLELCQAIMAS